MHRSGTGDPLLLVFLLLLNDAPLRIRNGANSRDIGALDNAADDLQAFLCDGLRLRPVAREVVHLLEVLLPLLPLLEPNLVAALLSLAHSLLSFFKSDAFALAALLLTPLEFKHALALVLKVALALKLSPSRPFSIPISILLPELLLGPIAGIALLSIGLGLSFT